MEVAPDIADLINKPISGDAPCGVAVKYEENFLQLEAELAKQESLTAATVDWRLVEQLARTILANESKDLLVSCYLAAALSQNQGYAGTLAGFQLVQGMIDQWWPDMYPPMKRLRGRTAALDWLVEKINWQLEANPPKGQDLASVPDLYQAISDLDAKLAEKMEDKAPDLTSLVRPLRQLKKSIEAELKAAAPATPPAAAKAEAEPTQSREEAQSAAAEVSQTPVNPAPASQPPPAPASTSAAPAKAEISADVSSDTEANKALRQIQDALRKLAGFYAESRPAEPRRFRLARYALWLNIDSLPPNKEGKTQVPPPPKDLASRARQALEQADYPGVIDQVEKQLVKLPYWFEGQRLLMSALEQMGGSHQAAMQVATAELKALLERLPGLLDLAYSDGTPFADEATRFWLSQAVLSPADSGSGQTVTDDLTEIQRSAVKLAASGKMTEAIDQLQNYARHSGSRRQEYRARLALAEMLLDSGQASAALPILMRLTDYIERHQLAEWEPDFARQSYQLLHLACTRAGDPEHPDYQRLILRQTAAFSELCWYDPGSAIG